MELFVFMFFCLSCGNETNALFGDFNVYDNNHRVTKQPDSDQPLFFIIFASIDRYIHRAVEQGVNVSEVDPVFPDVFRILFLVPLKFHFKVNVCTFCDFVKSVVSAADAEATLALLGDSAGVIGEVTEEHAGKVVLNTTMNTLRTIGVLTSDPLPRIC